MANNPNPGKREAKRVRAPKALELRIKGYSYRAIGSALRVSERTAYYDVQEQLAATAKLTAERAEECLAVELERLDRVVSKMWVPVGRGDARAAQAIIRASERRAKLLGLDKPTKLADPDGNELFAGVSDRLARFLADVAAARDAAAVAGPAQQD